MATADLAETGFDSENIPMQPLTLFEQRAVDIANLLSRGYTKRNIVIALVSRYSVNESEIYRAFPRAKEILRESTEHDLGDLIAIQLGRLEHIISARDELIVKVVDGIQHEHVIPGPSHRDKIAAIAEVNKLLGLHQPVKIAMTTPDGNSSVSLLSIIMNIEEGSRARVVDVSSIDATMLALPDLTEEESNESR